MPIRLFATVHDLRSNWHAQEGTESSACAASKLAKQRKPFFEYVPSFSHDPMMRRGSKFSMLQPQQMVNRDMTKDIYNMIPSNLKSYMFKSCCHNILVRSYHGGCVIMSIATQAQERSAKT